MRMSSSGCAGDKYTRSPRLRHPGLGLFRFALRFGMLTGYGVTFFIIHSANSDGLRVMRVN